jgi:hypothetical protein
MTDSTERRRRLGKQIMDGLTVVCVLAAFGVATSQVAQEGLQQFLYRPPGVGASPSEANSNPVAAPPTRQPAKVVTPSPNTDMLSLVLILFGTMAVGTVLVLELVGRLRSGDAIFGNE